MKSPVLMVALMVMTLSGGLNFVSAFAMHDSTLDVNTWIASNNSTELQTTDLNKGPVSPTTSTAATVEETPGPSIVTPTTPDEDGDDLDNEDEDGDDGDSESDSDSDSESNSEEE
jgi:hypothetical protein